ncbi:MAG: choice-of-anchor tandem repeat GloVer-containing protein [Candidatus Cybelea sp.]
MKTITASRYVLSIGVAAALLAGCGVLRQAQDDMQLPITGPGAMPQASALAARSISSDYNVLYSFAGTLDGNYPSGTLIDVGGKLYGTTEYGGGCNYSPSCGTVYSLSLDGHEKVPYRFASPPDGIYPLAGLIDVGGTLYGTTDGGGSNSCGGYPYYYSCGAVFSVTPSGTEKVLHSFSSPPDGALPAAPLIDVNGTLYGTTQYGGVHKNTCSGNCGTVFSITPSGTEKVLYSFGAGSDGNVPAASLIEVKRKLYGTTSGGGAYGWGTVFGVTLNGREIILHSFGGGTDGGNSEAGLIDVRGTFYGTTEVGGARTSGKSCNVVNKCGTVFSITPPGTEKVLHRFVGNKNDGAGPVASLIDVKGTLYGTTEYGGAYGDGTVFSISTSGSEHLLHSFGSGTDGKLPATALIEMDGTLYGTTTGGGTYQHGTVFGLTP